MNLRSASGTMVLGIVAIVVVLAASWLLLVSPVLGETSDTNDAIDAAEGRNQLMTTQVTALEAQQRNLARYEATADGLTALFPPTADQPGFFAAVTRAAGAAGIPAGDVTTLSPTAPQLLGPDGQPITPAESTAGDAAEADAADTAEVAQQTVSVTAEGTYGQVQQLLANLERMERAFVVTSLGLDSGGEDGAATGTLTISITGSTYVASPLTMAGPERRSSTSAAG